MEILLSLEGLKMHVKKIILFLLLLAVRLNADGGFVGPPRTYVQEPGQTALLYHENGKEVLVLQVTYAGAKEDFGWIVPLPSTPEVSLVSDKENPFPALFRYIHQRTRDYKTAKSFGGLKEAVKVIRPEFKLGKYNVVVLKAGDAGALETWLKKHGFHVAEGSRSVLQSYIEKGWVFTAVNLHPGRHPQGELQALRFEFSTENAVYPLRISSINKGLTKVHLYTLSPEPLAPRESDHWMRFDAVRAHWIYPATADIKNLEHIKDVEELQSRMFGRVWETGRRGLEDVYGLVGLSSSVKPVLAEYRAVLSPMEMDRDLEFEPAGSRDFWESAERSTNAVTRKAAVFMLAALDPERAREAADGEDALLISVALKFQADNLLPDQIRRLSKSKDGNIRRALVTNPQVPLKVILAMNYDLNNNKDRQLLGILMKRSDLGEAEIRILAERFPDLLPDLYGRPGFPEDLVFKMPLTPGMKWTIATNPSASREELVLLFGEEENNLVRTLVKNPNMNEELFDQWWAQAEPGARRSGAAAVSLGDVQKKLLKEDKSVRCGLARNHKLLPEIADVLFRDPVTVRCMADNSAGLNAGMIERLLRHPDNSVRCNLARNNCLSDKQKARLAKDKNKNVRAYLVSHARLSKAVFERLLEDKSPHVRSNAHLNSQVTRVQLERHLKDPAKGVREHAARVLKTWDENEKK